MIRLYRALLHLYPASFRREYGDEMTEVFAQSYADATLPGRIGLALRTLGDEVPNALAVHWAILIQDLRYTARTLNRARGFALTAILVTAVGVGAGLLMLVIGIALAKILFGRGERLWAALLMPAMSR